MIVVVIIVHDSVEIILPVITWLATVPGAVLLDGKGYHVRKVYSKLFSEIKYIYESQRSVFLFYEIEKELFYLRLLSNVVMQLAFRLLDHYQSNFVQQFLT